jgi:hypothetical protein
MVRTTLLAARLVCSRQRSDFNYVLKGGKCVQIDPEPIKSGECTTGAADETYLGSSGYRLIPGNTCDRAKESNKDEPIRKPCSQAEAPESKIQHQEFKFSAAIVQQQYFNNSYTLILLLQDHTAWQTSNEGYTWMQLGDAEDRFVAIYIHPYADDRAYLVTAGDRYLYTANTGRQWQYQRAPTRANTFGLPHLSFHPTQLDMPIWTGEVGCDSFGSECYVSAAWSYNGRAWAPLERYVRRCEWARDAELAADPTLVICESYTEKVGDQRTFGAGASLALVAGSRYFRNRREVFGHVAGFTKFPQFLVVAEVLPERGLLDLQVSLDGKTFAAGMFPQDMKLDTHVRRHHRVLLTSAHSRVSHSQFLSRQRTRSSSTRRPPRHRAYSGAASLSPTRTERTFRLVRISSTATCTVSSTSRR